MKSGLFNTVGCINKTCDVAGKKASAEHGDASMACIISPIRYGCSQLGDDLQYTQKLLASLANHGMPAAFS